MRALRHAVRVNLGRSAERRCRSRREARKMIRPLEREGRIGYLQFFNLHRESAQLRAFALSRRLGFWAAKLLGVPRVRLYQDALFMKRPGDGATCWHSDLIHAPFETNAVVNAWVPLDPVPTRAKGGTALCFGTGSHRDFSLAYWGVGDDGTDLTGRYPEESHAPLALGDATFHHGWTLHSAPALSRRVKRPRFAWALSFVGDGARIRKGAHAFAKGDEEDAVSFENWVRDLGEGEVADHHMLPLLPAP